MPKTIQDSGCLWASLSVLTPLIWQLSAPAIAQSLTLYVNPATTAPTALGTENAPFKTITQALQRAQADTTIRLIPGIYSEQTGEVFPIRLKPGVTLLGTPEDQGQGVVIRGGGGFLSPTFANQNVVIVGANQATLRGVTLTNTNRRGYGLWIESSSPVVQDNTFFGNSHDGVSITGNSTPQIQNNVFRGNGANGITAYGTSQGLIQDNLFDNTGFGITLAQQAAPQILRNRLVNNRSGIVIQGQARPLLRQNLIANNIQEGIVAIAQAQPDLGTAQSPGQNVFRNNGRYDIDSSATRNPIAAFGNQLNPNQTVGQLDLQGAIAPSASPPLPLTASTQPQARPVTPTSDRPLPSLTNTDTHQASTVIVIPVPPPETDAAPAPPPTPAQPTQLPPPASSTGLRLPVLQPSSPGELLPVPSTPAPVGSSNSPASPPPPTLGDISSLRYRVLVDTAIDTERLKALIPGAFRTTLKGRTVIQAGAFASRDKADELVQMLFSEGIQATIEQYN